MPWKYSDMVMVAAIVAVAQAPQTPARGERTRPGVQSFDRDFDLDVCYQHNCGVYRLDVWVECEHLANIRKLPRAGG